MAVQNLAMGKRMMQNIHAGIAKMRSMVLALFLKSVLGRNSPVKRMMMVEISVSATTRVASSRGAKMVESSKLASRMPYTTSTILFPTSIVLTYVLGFL